MSSELSPPHPVVPILFEQHMHTPLCKHAEGSPGEYAATAFRKGMAGIIVTCHCPLPQECSPDVRMSDGEFPLYLELIEQAREEWAGRVEVLAGLESDYIPGYESWVEKLHNRTKLHHVLGSVHPQMRDFRARFFRGDHFEYQQLYFSMLADAAETGLFDTLAHPDLIKNEPSDSWDLPRILPDIQRALDRIAKTGVAMELNTSGRYKRIPEMNPAPEILVEIGKRGIPVVIGADAHSPSRVGEGYREAMHLLLHSGIQKIGIYRNRQRTLLPIQAFLDAGIPG